MDFAQRKQESVGQIGKNEGKTRDRACIEFAMSRTMFRIARKDKAGRFIIKGGVLQLIHDRKTARPTSDIDMHSCEPGIPDIAALDHFMTTAFSMTAKDGDCYNDGFEVQSVKPVVLKHSGGLGRRYEVQATVGKARTNFHLDVGFGGTRPHDIEFRTIPNHEKWNVDTTQIACYPLHYVAAEKLHAVQTHGADNTRIRDYYDLAMFMEKKMVTREKVIDALVKTFEERGTEIDVDMFGLSDDYAPLHQAGWERWHLKSGLTMKSDLLDAVRSIRGEYRSMLMSAKVIMMTRQSAKAMDVTYEYRPPAPVFCG